MPITLAQMSQLATDPLKKGVIDTFRQESLIMDRLSFEDAGALSIEVIRTKTLPSVGWRKIGAAYSEGIGVTEPMSERVHFLGASVDVDKAYVEAKNTIINHRANQTEMITKSIALGFNDAFINGDPEANEDILVGLWYRLQKLGQFPSSQNINLNGLDISPDASGLSANFDAFLDALQTLIHACDMHKADVLMCNDTLYLRLLSALRQKGLFATTQDSFGRKIVTYGEGGPEIWDVGYKADQTTRIIGNAELNDGSALSGGGATSIYAIKWGEPYVAGFQEYALDVKDLGLLNDGVTYRTVVDWAPGIYIVHPRAVARLSGIIAA